MDKQSFPREINRLDGTVCRYGTPPSCWFLFFFGKGVVTGVVTGPRDVRKGEPEEGERRTKPSNNINTTKDSKVVINVIQYDVLINKHTVLHIVALLFEMR